jgi:amidophosphoribosyltransferase
MSDPISHECGIALIRLKKPLAWYARHHGSARYGFNKLFLLMEKQHNRGQDGAGIGCVKLDMPLGHAYMHRQRVLRENSLGRLFKSVLKTYDKQVAAGIIHPELPDTVKQHFEFGGEVLMGHLRYGTSGTLSESSCHPYFRRSNWPTRNLMVCGNFNMTNTAELNRIMVERGQHPIYDTDTQTILEEIGYHLDEAHNHIYRHLRDAGMHGEEIPQHISRELDMCRIIRKSATAWDGGYVIAGMVGNGDAFVLRDPRGIRPAYVFENDEVLAVASERVPLMTAFDVGRQDIRELTPGHVLAIKHNGTTSLQPFADPLPRASCLFERIYFSRGNDPEIYQERKAMGATLAPAILQAIDHDLGHAVFSYIPNTAETASYGLLAALRLHRRQQVKTEILAAQAAGTLTEALLDELILGNWPRAEKIAHKDIKLRTFIANESGRSKMVSHVYDITYDVVGPADNLVVLDDSIVRGTTLRESIIKMLSRTNPRRIIIASTAPQIRFPDCYGIDMSELGKFIAFQAAIELLLATGASQRITEVYQQCLIEIQKPKEQQRNCVKDIYAPFSDDQIAAQIAHMLYPRDLAWSGELVIIFQRIADLQRATPQHTGDWYFTGNYPTPGGTAVCNHAFIQYYEKRSGRSYS